MIKRIYKRAYYKYLDIIRKNGFRCRRIKYFFHPDIQIGKNVRIWKNVRIEILYGGKIVIGDNTEIMDGCRLWTYGGEIIVGTNCSINPYTVIYGQGNTRIGNDVLIAGHSMIIPSNHIFDDTNKLIREQGLSAIGVVINDNVWIAHGCTIMDGVEIGRGAVIGAGSVVNKNIQEFSVNVGVPVKLIKTLK